MKTCCGLASRYCIIALLLLSLPTISAYLNLSIAFDHLSGKSELPVKHFSMGKYTAEQKLQLLNNLDLESEHQRRSLTSGLLPSSTPQHLIVYNDWNHGCSTTS
jgi:hypothetical protein